MEDELMVRIKLNGNATKEAADVLKKRAEPMLTRFSVTEAKVARGACKLALGGQSYEPYYVMTFVSPDACPVRKYVAYEEGGELKTRALLKADKTVDDLKALENA